ncbi:MAG: glycosyltransferase family 4 protein [Verrucomicrobiota bacterium]
MKIIFFTLYKHVERLEDTKYCDAEGLGGSETACSYAVEYFRERGHEIEICTDWQQLRNGSCDIFISLRETYSFVQGLQPGKLNYLWCHDDVDEPFLPPLRDAATAKKIYDLCDGVIVLSHFQRERWQRELNLPTSKVFMSSNGIPLKKFLPATTQSLENRPRRAYYASNPYRGLNILLSVWPQIREFVPEAELWLFSSFQTYGDSEKEKIFKPLYDLAKSLEPQGVVLRGSVGQAALRSAAAQCRLMVYPSTFNETSCIAAMEAMAAGCVVAGVARGALPETAWRNPLMPQHEELWMDYWLMEVSKLLLDHHYYMHHAARNLQFAQLLDWENVFDLWLIRFRQDAALKNLKLAL